MLAFEYYVVIDAQPDCLNSAGVGDRDGRGGLATPGAVRFNLLHDVHAGNDLAEHDMCAIKPGRDDSCDEELEAIRSCLR